VYERNEDKDYKGRIYAEWQAAGSPKFEWMNVWWECHILAVFRRPSSHFKADGVSLSAAGARAPHPPSSPDVDQIAKAPMDVLVKAGAVPDDARCCRLTVDKKWEVPGLSEGVYVRIVEVNK
jgi:Holliday junction resolvase RusA-like endonuclease